MEKNKLWTVIKIILVIAAIGVAAYAIYRKFFMKKVETKLGRVEKDTPGKLEASEAEETDEVADETVEISAEDVIANAEAMEV